MKTISKLFLTLTLLAVFSAACEDPPDFPTNERISASASGLTGVWQSLELTSEYAIAVLDEDGEAVLDDKLEGVYKDTIVYFYPDGIITEEDTTNFWREVLYLRTEVAIDTFDFLPSVDMVDVDTAIHSGRSVGILSGHWHVLKTTNPSGKVDDVTSLVIKNPEDIHFVGNTKIMSILEVTGERLILQYGHGETVNDTLITKTYEKVQ